MQATMAKKKFWTCPECRELVRNLGRHQHCKHLQNQSPSSDTVPDTVASLDAAMSTPQHPPLGSAKAAMPWTPPEWWCQPTVTMQPASGQQTPAADDWLAEPLCSIGSPSLDDSAPVAEQVQDASCSPTADTAAEQAGVETYSNDVSCQTSPSAPTEAPRLDHETSSPRRTRLRVINPPSYILEGMTDVSFRDFKFAGTFTSAATRRMCECTRCIRDAVRLFSVLRDSDDSPTPGLRFDRLPGLSLPDTSCKEQTKLLRLVDRHPNQATVVCRWVTCTLHRNLCKAWIQARQLPPPPWWEVVTPVTQERDAASHHGPSRPPLRTLFSEVAIVGASSLYRLTVIENDTETLE